MDRKLLLLFLSFTLLLLPACSDSSSATFDNIRKNRLVTIGSVPFEAPLLYQRGQEWVGPEAQLGMRIVERIRETMQQDGTSIQVEEAWIGLNYSGLISPLEKGEVSFVLGVFGITEDRKERVEFSEAYYFSELTLIINPIHKDLRPNLLEGENIGVREATAVEQFVRAKYPNSTVVPFKTLDDAILALKRGEISAAIDDRYMAAYSLDTMPGVGHLEIIPTTLGSVDCGVAVRKQDTRLLEMVNEIISQVKAEDLYMQWLEGEPKDQLARVEQRHPDRLERDSKAAEPRRITIRVSKDDNYDFDIYRLANLSFTLTNEESGKRYTSSRIDFPNRIGVSSVTVPPGTYKIVLPKYNNWSPGVVIVQPSDPNRITVNIRLLTGGQVRMTRS
ncbi:transporter substrate-binding domain-containing protein [Acidobacteria bacterium AH-259-D05]|nr:transporter substrate-binding domain-containing protein [Acidobacteria bacterium AH-259-D05]